jgi:tetratricopeptide (TPR) repeat protein
MLPHDVFFTDVEKVIAEFTEADRPRLGRLIAELGRIANQIPSVADRCYEYQAQLYAKLQDYPAALAAIEQALQLMPLDDNLRILRGDIYRQAAEDSQALRDYSQVLDKHPESVTARMRRSDLRRAEGKYSDALEDINTALKLEPRSLRLTYRRGLILADLRRTTEAIADFKTVARLSPDKELKSKAEQRLRELGEA